MTIENAFASTRETCHAALLHFGGDAQLKKANEELGELLTALSRYPTRATPAEVADEIADVFITVRQLAMLFGDELVADAITRKAERLRATLAAKEASR